MDEFKHTPKHYDEYYSGHMVNFEKFNSIGWESIKVLEFLNGKQWDDVALGYVHALRPSSIRVTTGCITLDAMTWRVTVYIDEDNTIDYVTQEVGVGLPDGVAHGKALADAMRYGIDSPQCIWHRECDGGYMYSNEGAFAKYKGEWIKYPEPDSTTEK